MSTDLTLFCYVLNDRPNMIFPVDLPPIKTVDDLRNAIKAKKSSKFQDIDANTLRLWSASIFIDSTFRETIAKTSFSDEDCLSPWTELSEIFPAPADGCVHVVVRIPAVPASRKRQREARVRPPLIVHRLSCDNTIQDVSRQLFKLWTAPVSRDIQELKTYIEGPLDPDWKVPLSQFEWNKLLKLRCHDEDLELLFRHDEEETADAVWYLLRAAIVNDSLDEDGTKESLHGFWDANICAILVRCLRGDTIRISSQGTGSMRPNFGLLLSRICVFRGEEERRNFTGIHPRQQLIEKTRWVYGSAPYVMGYHAVGVRVVLAAITQQVGETVAIHDIGGIDLSSQSERIKNACRMIKLCGVLKNLQLTIGEGADRDMFSVPREDGKLIEYYKSYVRKTYDLESARQGVDSVYFLKSIYASLAAKDVPNVDQLKKAEILHRFHGSYVDVMPRGSDAGPESLLDVRNAVVCILEALKVLHAEPAIFHRDIRWPNVMQKLDDRSKWFLIDWEDASFVPTKAVVGMSPQGHSPKVFEDNHGAEVDIWGVGWLIISAPKQDPNLTALGREMTDGHILNAEQGLEKLHNIQF